MNTPVVGKALKGMVQSEGVFGLWRGLGASLYRDVPFSGIYWAVYESLKSHYEVSAPTFTFSFVGGAVAGSVSELNLKFHPIPVMTDFLIAFRRQHSRRHHSMLWKHTSRSSSARRCCTPMSHKSNCDKQERIPFCWTFIVVMDSVEFSPVLRRALWKWHRLAR